MSISVIALGYNFDQFGARIVGIDGKEVSVYNPVRQIYSTADIGVPKAFALARMLVGRTVEDCKMDARGRTARFFCNDGRIFVGIREEMEDSRAGAARFDEILGTYAPDLVVLTTAHPAEFRMADAARKRGIPHIVGRCYARARWFEITAVDAVNRTPCFGCLQGHLYTGAPPTLTDEELARYEPQQASALVQGEPATRIETARCADIISRAGMEFLKPSLDARSEWFSRMVAEERNCLIGGNYAEYNNGDWTYGVESPGGVALYGVINFIGSETEQEKTCLYCARTHQVLIHRRPVQLGTA